MSGQQLKTFIVRSPNSDDSQNDLPNLTSLPRLAWSPGVLVMHATKPPPPAPHTDSP